MKNGNQKFHVRFKLTLENDPSICKCVKNKDNVLFLLWKKIIPTSYNFLLWVNFWIYLEIGLLWPTDLKKIHIAVEIGNLIGNFIDLV